MSMPIEAPTLLLVAGMLLLVMTFFRMARRGRTSAARPTPIVKTPSPSIPTARVADEVEVRLYNTFRELNARLENKIHVLNDLVIESETKIRRLEQLLPAAGNKEPRVAILDEANPNHGAAPPSQRFAEIYQMADRGMTPAEISQRVDQPIGEVQLILGLRQRRKSG
jgi:hypothetical protein